MGPCTSREPDDHALVRAAGGINLDNRWSYCMLTATRIIAAAGGSVPARYRPQTQRATKIDGGKK